MDTSMIYLLLALVITLMIIVIVLLVKDRKKETETKGYEELQLQLQKQLLDFQNAISGSFRNDFNILNENTGNKLQDMERAVNDQLRGNLESTNKTLNEVIKQVVRIDESQDQLKTLSEDISGLHMIFNDKKTRGTYGEIQLYTLLDKAFGDNQQLWQRQYQLSANNRVDAVIFGNDALGLIPIDSKFPLENYNRLMDAQIAESRKQPLINAFKQDVKNQINSIADKYIIEGVTAPFAYMFIPAEAIFSYITANLEDIIDYSYDRHVYLVSPTTLMAYVTAIKALYIGQKKNEKMADIQKELLKLQEEFDRFTVRYRQVQKDFGRISDDMRDVLITAGKISNRFEQIQNVELDDEKKEIH